VVVAVVGVALAASGCRSGDAEADDGASSTVEVVASFYPLAEAASRVGGDAVTVRNLTPAGVEPHDLELTSDQVDRLLDADVVLYLGQGFQPAVEKIVGQRDRPGVDLLDGVDLRPGEGGGDTALDPHLWLDPTRMVAIAEAVEAALASVDPADAGSFAASRERYAGELAELDQAMAAGLGDCARRELVTTHTAFSYLAARYGLTQIAISGISPDAEPDADRLAELADRVRADGVTTVFTETLVSPEVAEALAREAGVTAAELDPIEGLTEDEVEAGDSYSSLMRRNLAVLRTALGCR
jgi:zinc transport system substrate-binding protein